MVKWLERNGFSLANDGCHLGSECYQNQRGDFVVVSLVDGFWQMYLAPGDGEQADEEGEQGETPEKYEATRSSGRATGTDEEAETKASYFVKFSSCPDQEKALRLSKRVIDNGGCEMRGCHNIRKVA